MRISKNGLNFLKKEEGFRKNAYQDSVGVWTIGYGNTRYENGTPVKKGDTVTDERAEQLFLNTLKTYENAVNSTIKAKLNQNQFDALVSLTYNIGTAGFSRSKLAKLVNQNPEHEGIKQQFEAWRFAGGKPILLNRRKREYDLYSSYIELKKKA